MDRDWDPGLSPPTLTQHLHFDKVATGTAHAFCGIVTDTPLVHLTIATDTAFALSTAAVDTANAFCGIVTDAALVHLTVVAYTANAFCNRNRHPAATLHRDVADRNDFSGQKSRFQFPP